MKKKLFAVAVIVSVYVLCVFIFTALDKQGKVPQFFSKIGLSTTSAIASTASNEVGLSNSDIELKASFRSPIPKPSKKPAPRPKLQSGDAT